MREADFDDFSAMLDDVAGLYPRGSVSIGQKAMFFRALAAHSIADVRDGFDAHVKDTARGRFLPMPADVLAQIEGLAADDGRLGPEEAWAQSMRCADESKTIVWTGEMAEAWSIAMPLFHNGDEIGARMAFKESYVRLVDEARRARRKPVWAASLGFDPLQRAETLWAAHVAGRLPKPEFAALPAPEQSLALIASNPSAPPDVLEKLRALRARLAQRADAPSLDAAAKSHTADLKAQVASRVAEYGYPQ